MKIKAIYALILLVFLPSVVFAERYIDINDTGSSNLGTWAEPYNSVTTLNTLTLVPTGEDFYFKPGTHTFSSVWSIGWNGESGNYATIGCASAEGVFTCSSYPVISGNSQTVPTQGVEQGLIHVSSKNYVKVENLRLNDSGGKSVMFVNCTYSILTNFYSYNSWGNGVMVSRSKFVEISYGTVERAKYTNTTTGACIEITGVDAEDTCESILVRYVTVFNGRLEGIGFYKKVKNCIVEHCTVYDIASYHIYMGPTSDVTVRYNLVYDTPSSNYARSVAYAVNNELYRHYCYTGPQRFYGNVAIGTYRNMTIGCEVSSEIPTCYWPYTYVFNNTFIDATAYNMKLWTAGLRTGTNINIWNNIFYTVDGTGHVQETSATGVDWNNNSFYGGVIPTGDPATGAYTASAPGLVKTSGFLTLVAGSVSKDQVSLSSDLSYAVDKGIAHATVTSGTTGTTVSVDRGYAFTGDETVSVDSGDDGTSDFTDTLTANGATSITFSSSHTFSTGDTITIVMDDIAGNTNENPWGGVYVDLGALELSAESPNPGPAITYTGRINHSYPMGRILH